jgi:hypothetical protein
LIVQLLLILLPAHPEPWCSGCAVFPYAWSDDALSCLAAPAGLVRLDDWQVQLLGRLDGQGDSPGISGGAAAFPLGPVSLGAGGGWSGTSDSDTLDFQVSAAGTVRGDPIGFMDGVFGPSISVGSSLSWTSAPGGQGCLSTSLGFQFSVFPTIAVGADASGLRLAGDKVVGRTLGYGVTCIYDRSFRAHLSVREGEPAIGAELMVTEVLTVRTGSDGGSWDAGVTALIGDMAFDYALSLMDSGAVHWAGITFTPGGSN